MESGIIPIIDLENLSGGTSDNGPVDAQELDVGNQLCQAFRTLGCAYLINHGIPKEEIKAVKQASAQFFQQSEDFKQQFRSVSVDELGWQPLEAQTLNPKDRPADYNEAFDAKGFDGQRWPDETIPEFKETLKQLNNRCEELLLRLLHLVARGLKLEDAETFVKGFPFGQAKTLTVMRTLWYPADTHKYKENQIGCGEHSDWGALTLLMQDDVGGLQIFDRETARYIDATPIEGSVIVNVGDMLQRWTADELHSPMHRVVMPEQVPELQRPRQSLVFFGQPAPDTVVSCIDGSNKYQPITAGDYINEKASQSYKYH